MQSTADTPNNLGPHAHEDVRHTRIRKHVVVRVVVLGRSAHRHHNAQPLPWPVRGPSVLPRHSTCNSANGRGVTSLAGKSLPSPNGSGMGTEKRC